MTSLYVENLPLPNLLIEMISSGRWVVPSNKHLLESLGIEDVEELVFLSLPSMIAQTLYLKELASSGYNQLMSLTTENTASLDGYLNVSQAVVIAANLSDEAICLDYSSLTSPRVVASNNANDEMHWEVVAETFEDFVKLLNL